MSHQEEELERLRVMGEGDAAMAFLYQFLTNLLILFDHHLPPVYEGYVNACLILVRERGRTQDKHPRTKDQKLGSVGERRKKEASLQVPGCLNEP